MAAQQKIENGYFTWEPEEGKAPTIEPMNLIFARVMEILTYVGMIVMLEFIFAMLKHIILPGVGGH
jgi:hypothetical protein